MSGIKVGDAMAKKTDLNRDLYAALKIFDIIKNAPQVYKDAQKEYDEKTNNNNGNTIELLDAVKQEMLRRYDITQLIGPLIPEKHRKSADWLLSAPLPIFKKIVDEMLSSYNDSTTAGEFLTDMVQKGLRKYVLKMSG